MMLAFFIPLLPLATFGINFLFFRNNRTLAPWIAVSGIAASFLLTVYLLLQGGLELSQPFIRDIPWITVTTETGYPLKLYMGIMVDRLSLMMLFVVTLVATLVHIYAVGYMHDEERISHFFQYLNLFCFSMLGLVLAPNLYQMYVFWELVGLASYLLIGFYYKTPSANEACKKAFVVNRVGDFGMFLGIVFLSYYLGTAGFGPAELPAKIAQWPLLGPSWLPLGLVALLLFCGAVAKSAQFPLHVWLPDAMEGPTPVSALVHSATMVAAGIYLLARCFFVFDAATLSSVNAGLGVAWVGGITCLMAAIIALTQWDIKRVLAYSTLSQLGYMVMALGAGAVASGKGLEATGATAGSFHLFTHAFFKCLLFLGAGSVIHAVHSNDIRDMGGLLKKMPITGKTFFIACLSIAGIFPFAGFFSKDEILLALHQAQLMPLYWIAVGVAFMTSFYMFRIFFITFTGAEKQGSHAHESPATMTFPLIVLAVFALGAGWTTFGQHNFAHYIHYERNPAMQVEWDRTQALATEFPRVKGTLKAHKVLDDSGLSTYQSISSEKREDEGDHAFHFHPDIALPATLVALLGILLAWAMYVKKVISAERIARAFGPLYKLSYNKFYIDEIYLWLLHKVYLNLSKAIANFDRRVIDGFMNGLAWASQAMGGVLKLTQSGQVQSYALAFFFGLTLLLLYLKGFGL